MCDRRTGFAIGWASWAQHGPGRQTRTSAVRIPGPRGSLARVAKNTSYVRCPPEAQAQLRALVLVRGAYEVAALLGVNRWTISNALAGGDMTPSRLARILQVLARRNRTPG
jgi:hypothetical protein